MEHVPRVGIPPRGVAHREEPVVEEGGEERGPPHEDHHDDDGHEENLREGGRPQDVATLLLHEGHEGLGQPGVAPAAHAEGVEQGEGVGGRVEGGEERDGHQHHRDGVAGHEEQAVEEVVRRVFGQ